MYARTSEGCAGLCRPQSGDPCTCRLMLVLFDQGTPVGIRDSLQINGHVVKTARQQGWDTLLNGELLRVAEEAGFDVLLTTAKNLVNQQNLSTRKTAILVLGQTRWSLIQPMLETIAASVNDAKAGSYTVIQIPLE